MHKSNSTMGSGVPVRPIEISIKKITGIKYLDEWLENYIDTIDRIRKVDEIVKEALAESEKYLLEKKLEKLND